ncbi:gastrotropin-like protein [Lates japonicus]|uniref:Gastrotropin-like protein n=1 Tax=Lates japonicus TaxID=270547 RepID=A0AAD3MVW7_LATJO|nr:gastrotropin-like protein [Lates japonicus]
MAFTGKYVLESQENCEEFFKALGITNLKDSSSDAIITDIYQNDDFRLTKTWNNTFPIGKEAELETVDGKTFKTLVTLDEGNQDSVPQIPLHC